jgi:UDP-N-acetylmuramyl pentapeptide phosphotransferase/UDP-N-acetylglucosamine-1-phosphate transferase
MTVFETFTLLCAAFAAAAVSASLIWLLRPLLSLYALARPNARSSHRTPTPQGAGVAVIAATLLVAGSIIGGTSATGGNIPLAVFGATLFMSIVGFADDVKSIDVFPRLMLQAMAVGAIIFSSSDDQRIFAAGPIWLERGILLLAGIWFVNLVNFMDGLDWMTVAEIVPITTALILLGTLNELPATTTVIAASLCGAMLGFAPFNRPVATIFLGDVGSLPIGLLSGWCLLQLAYHHQFAAALLLPLYYLFDATSTLWLRFAKRETFWTAHRSHFYQRATDNGFTVWRVVSEVFILNIGLAVLAIASAMTEAPANSIVYFALGCIAVGFVMYRFSRPRQPFYPGSRG